MPTLMTTSPNSRTILLVDDDRLVLATISQGLSVKGYKVVTAESAEDAEVALASGERPNLAIVDVNMPGKSGFELAERLRSLDHVPFIFLSAYSDPDFVEQASSLGALSYLIKPTDPLKIAPVVEAALARAEELKSLRDSERRLQAALDNEREISVAVGIAMMQYRLERRAAFELVRNTARKRRIKLIDLARNVISAAETLNFDPLKST